MRTDRVILAFNPQGIGGYKFFTTKCRQSDFQVRMIVRVFEKFHA